MQHQHELATRALRIGGQPWSRALEGGLLLGQGGEFAFVAIGYAMTSRVLDPALGAQVMLVVGLIHAWLGYNPFGG